MRRKERGIGLGWWVLLGGVGISLLVFVILLGPGRAVRIAAASFLSTTVDGLAEDPGPHRLRVLDVHVDPSLLDTLESDLPWSGGKNIRATLAENGVEYPAKFRYRGMYSASHYLGGKKSFRLSLKKKNPFAPYRKLNVINPKSLNLLNNHLGNWIAGRMGVAVPYDEMVFVRLNDRDHGVMELYEQVDGSFEKIRGTANDDVPVYRGEFAPVSGRELPEKRMLWRDARHWEYVSKADSTLAHARLSALISVIYDSTLTIQERRDTLAQLIDVEAYMRYMAAILVVNTKHMDQYHNQWLVMRADGRFYPIWWDALLMFPPAGEPLYYIHDALAFWLLQVPEWRLQRDRYAYEAMLEMHEQGAFTRKLDRTIQRIMPSVLTDHNKFGTVTSAPMDVHRNSLAHVIGSMAGMRTTVATHWDRTLKRLRANDVVVVRTDTLRIQANAEAAIRLSWSEVESESKEIYVNGERREPELLGDHSSIVLHRTLKLPDGSWNRPFANWQHFNAEPLDVSIRFPRGLPADLRITNAVTDEAIR